MKNAKIVASNSRAFVIRLPEAPPHHGWALRYKSGSEDLDANTENGPLWISEFRPKEGRLAFGDNPWLWDSQADAKKVSDHLREQFELQTEVEHFEGTTHVG